MNIGEIARRAGVSRSTVSYALSGKRPVSDDTRQKIQRVIDELGYRPNASARALANGRTSTLGLVFPPAGTHYTGMQLDFIGSVVEAAAAYDYDVLLSPSGADSDRSFQRLLGERRVDGAILMEIRLQDDRIDHLVAENFPAVCIGRTAQPDGDWWVGLDHTALAAACVDHLADLGHRRIALVNRPERMLRAGYESAHRGLDGFTKAAAERGLTARTYNCGDDAPPATCAWSRSCVTTRPPRRWSRSTRPRWAVFTVAWPRRAAMCRATSPSPGSWPAGGRRR